MAIITVLDFNLIMSHLELLYKSFKNFKWTYCLSGNNSCEKLRFYINKPTELSKENLRIKN